MENCTTVAELTRNQERLYFKQGLQEGPLGYLEMHIGRHRESVPMNCVIAALSTDFSFLSSRMNLAVLFCFTCLKLPYLVAWLGLQDLLPWLMLAVGGKPQFFTTWTHPKDCSASSCLGSWLPPKRGTPEKARQKLQHPSGLSHTVLSVVSCSHREEWLVPATGQVLVRSLCSLLIPVYEVWLLVLHLQRDPG